MAARPDSLDPITLHSHYVFAPTLKQPRNRTRRRGSLRFALLGPNPVAFILLRMLKPIAHRVNSNFLCGCSSWGQAPGNQFKGISVIPMATPAQSREVGQPNRTLKLFQVDAFTPTLFEGNPAAVCPLKKWLPDEVLQNIAAENNLAETAYFVETDQAAKYNLRWFTPTQEVDLCGHATLASAHVLFEHLGVMEGQVAFSAKGGALTVKRGENGILWMDFPALPVTPVESASEVALLKQGLGVERIIALFSSTYDYLVELENEDDVMGLKPDFAAIKKLKTRGVIATSRGKEMDFVSRFFAPAAGIDEDPVTGSAHCVLAPFWGSKLKKTKVTAKQLSPRGGFIRCNISNDRVLIGGQAVTYMEGLIRY